MYSSPHIISTINSSAMRWAGRMGDKNNAYRVLVGRPARKRPLE
jgi:hypothetical protein